MSSLPHTGIWLAGVFDLLTAVRRITKRIYDHLPRPAFPIDDKTPRKIDRNAAIHARYLMGELVSDLAKEFGISQQRVYQILQGQRT